eukprot:44756-Chlamydomonas_euryale.AAC.2
MLGSMLGVRAAPAHLLACAPARPPARPPACPPEVGRYCANVWRVRRRAGAQAGLGFRVWGLVCAGGQVRKRADALMRRGAACQRLQRRVRERGSASLSLPWQRCSRSSHLHVASPLPKTPPSPAPATCL